jgi:hypothetical protein
MAREFWRFVLVQKKVAELAETAVDFPPMQAPATFNLDAVKREIEEKLKGHAGQDLIRSSMATAEAMGWTFGAGYDKLIG